MIQIQQCTLVPRMLFREEASRCLLSDLYTLEPDVEVGHVEIERFDAVMIYTVNGDQLPELYYMLCDIDRCSQYNKIMFSHHDGYLHLVIALGDKLQLANTYKADDFTTAQYYLFFAMKSLQLNPEISTVSVRSPLDEDMEMSLYRYFQGVEKI